MMSESTPVILTVEGESARALFDLLFQAKHGESADGLTTMTIELPAEELAPMRRALMRIEAELLLDDAASWTGKDDEPRTDEQRRFDAFELLAHRTCDALAGLHQ